jgi:ribosomal protein S30
MPKGAAKEKRKYIPETVSLRHYKRRLVANMKGSHTVV